MSNETNDHLPIEDPNTQLTQDTIAQLKVAYGELRTVLMQNDASSRATELDSQVFFEYVYFNRLLIIFCVNFTQREVVSMPARAQYAAS